MINADGNALLDLIAQADGAAAASVLADANLTDVASGETLQFMDAKVESCYFPVHGVLTLASDVDPDNKINTLALGFDAAVNASMGTDLNHASRDVVARLPSRVWRVDAIRWHAFVESNQTVRRLVAMFSDFLLQRAQQMLACEMRHDVECRVCRSLIEMHRWQRGRSLEITHQGLSELLGVRRTTITLIARALQDAGIISYKRGTIDIVDLYALRQASCPCHKIRHAWNDLCETVPSPSTVAVYR